VPAEHTQRVGTLQVVVFLDELALLAALAVAGAQIGGGTLANAARAVAFPLIAAAIWGRWLAPRARSRLAHPARLGTKLALIAVASALLIAADLARWGVIFFLVSALVVTAGEFAER
jgi:Protein of unknown function (DUF2568)